MYSIRFMHTRNIIRVKYLLIYFDRRNTNNIYVYEKSVIVRKLFPIKYLVLSLHEEQIEDV